MVLAVETPAALESPITTLAAAVPEAVRVQVLEVAVVLPEPFPEVVTRFEFYEELEDAAATEVAARSVPTGEVLIVQAVLNGLARAEVPL